MLIAAASAVHADPVPTLSSPLQGNILSRTITSHFGDNWNNTYCGGYIKKHTGIDVYANSNENVYAAYSGYVRKAQLDATWGGYVSVDHGPASTFNLVTTYWHVIPSVSAGTWVGTGQKIGTVADLGSGTHLHFSTFEAGWMDVVAYAGALPQTNCGGYPAFPSYFKNPTNYTYTNK
ncbi:hypothetical protein A3C87_01540 [Candidatus Kaiserbacteria bacterium RIFCSPHIGHO2_02_FULL_49_34]|uniref:M23ase beta-sheet core domain-containing protein n=1 Tax=Candidatus Kaiserbacteria bacterium RIFCSPHIGHO2_02_FULL_49_34 TaxID=1798491 RepID=A0A1F6DIP2_9BACT|nr:MAG: hypothetical protein A3C87_01540 [Candidatus Kaiserbacteria bacterium RIFCSPHIGHO2_02_FULL_49_34]